MVHDDGDAEDVESHELEKAAKYYDDGIEEQPDSDEDEVLCTTMRPNFCFHL